MTTKHHSGSRPRPRKRGRRGVVAAAALVLAALLYLLPQTPAGRGWLLSKAQEGLAGSGYALDFAESAGNPWRGVTLREVALTGPGVDVSLGRLEVSYTLPALLTGRLPLVVDAQMLRGEVSPREFPERVGEGGGLSIEPVLRGVTLDDAALTVAGTPFTLPDLSLSGLTVAGEGGAYRARGTVTTPDGSTTLGGTLRLDPFALEADIPRADLSLARPWWGGAQGGTLAGRVRVQDGEVTGSFDLQDATTTLAGITLTDVSGPVELEYPRINANLAGRALGGPVTATGRVDVEDRQWQAEVTGSAELAEAAGWLARGRLSEEWLDTLPLTGSAEVSLTASGWREVALNGSAAGAGTVAGRALESLNVDFGFESGAGTDVTAVAEVAGVPVAVELRPREEGIALQARASDVPLGILSEAWGERLSVEADGIFDPEGARLTLRGESSLGETLAGAFSLNGGVLQGEVAARDLTAPLLSEPFTLRLLAGGPLEELPLALELGGAEPLELTAGGGTLAADLRGRATATLRGSALSLEGDFGGLQLGGNFDVSSRRGSLTYNLADTPLRGPVAGNVSVEEGTITLDGETFRTEARLLTSPLDAAALRLPALDAGVALEAGTPGGLSAMLQDPDHGLALALQQGEATATFENTPVTLGGEAAVLDGRGSFRADAPLASLLAELSVAGAGVAARLEGDARVTLLELQTEPGLELGPLTLARAADVSGTLDLRTRRAELTGQVGALEGTLDADLQDGAASLTLQSGGEALRVDARLEEGALTTWTTAGSLPLDPLGEALGLPVTGTLDSDLSAENGFYEGTVTFDGSVQGQTVRGALRGAGDDLLVEAQAPVAGQTATLSGTLLPELGARLELPFIVGGETHIAEGTLSGPPFSPTLDGAVSGPFIEGPLELDRAGATSTLTLEPAALLPDGVTEAFAVSPVTVTFNATPDARWRAVATTTDAAAEAGALPLNLQVEVTGEGARYAGGGTLELSGESIPFTVEGEGDALLAEALLRDVALEPLNALLPLSLTGAADGTVGFRTGEGLSEDLFYTADLALVGAAQGQPFDLAVTASPQHVSVTGEAAGALVSASGTPADGFGFEVEDAGRALGLKGRLELTNGLTLEGAGELAGEPLTLSASYNLDEARASLEASVAGATVSGSLQGTRFEAQARVPAGILPSAAQAEVTGAVSADGVTVGELQVHSALLDQPLTLRLDGKAWPDTNLTGTLTWLTPDPTRVSVVKSESLYKVFLKRETLLASAYLEDGALSKVGLEGEASLNFEDVGRVAVTSDLAWTPEGGYRGGAEVTLGTSETPTSTQAEFALEGDGGLTVTGNANAGGAGLELDARLGPSLRDPALGGNVQLEALLSSFVPAWPGEEVFLTGDVALSGSARAPAAAGSVALRGALEADGTLQASLDGGAVSLTGPGLELSASGDADGWVLTTEARSLNVAPVLPQVDVPLLSGTLTASQDWGEASQASFTGLELWTLRSEVSGALQYDGELTGDLGGHVNLADLQGAPLRGTLRGELALGAGTEELTGRIEAENLGLEAASWGLSGVATLAGSPASPELDLSLTGVGSATGTLAAAFSPQAGRASVRSDLAVAGLSSDLAVTLSPGDVEASGGLAWGDYGLTVDTANAGNASPLLRGTGALAGWALELEPRLDAPLAGTLTGAQVGGVPLGPVAFRGAGGTLNLEGEALAGTLELGAGGLWTLERLALPLPAGLRLEASGAGGLTQGALAGTLAGELAGEAVTAEFAGEFGDGALLVTADGGLLAGNLNLNARFEEGWTGGLELTGARLGGVTAEVRGELSGALAAPQLNGRLEASGGALGEGALSGTFGASPQGVLLEQTLASPLLSAPLTLSGEVWPAPALLLKSGDDGLELSQNPDGGFTSEGSLTLEAAGFGLALAALEGSGELGGTLRTPLPGFVLAASLPDAPEMLTVRLEGRERAGGALVLAWDEGLTLAAEGLSYRTEAGTLSLSGVLAGLEGTLDGRWTGTGGDLLPWLAEAEVPLSVDVADARVGLSSESALGRLEAAFDRERGALELDAALGTGAGEAALRLAYTPEAGPEGNVLLDAVPLLSGDAPLTLSGDLELGAQGLAGDARLLAGGGTLRAEGALGWGLLPEGLRAPFPLAEETLRGSLRAANVDLAALPGVGLPYLHAPLSGVAEFGGRNVVGQLLIPEARVLDTSLPTELEFNGTLDQIDVRGALGESRVNLGWDGATLSGLVNLEGFPLQTVAEAVVGDTGVEASLTGVARLRLPVAAPASGTIEVATERVRLARGGVVSEGNAAFRYEAGALIVDEVRFGGAGEWRAQGRVTRDALDLSVEAENADFGPLLGLAPRLAELGVGAAGSFTLRAGGSLADPDVTFSSPNLAFEAGGLSGRLDGTEGRLAGETLALTSTFVGASPVTGALALEGGGRVSLSPLETSGLRFGFEGAVSLPVLGEVETLRGNIAAEETGWTLDAAGSLGAPFELAGTLAPLDLRLTGEGLNVRAPRYFLAESATDADLRLRAGGQGDGRDAFVVSGALEAREALLVGDREAGEVPGAGEAVGEGVEGAVVEGTVGNAAVEDAVEDAVENAVGAANPLFERVLFDDVRVRAPQEVRFTAGYGSAELGLDVTVSGSAAAPRLSGEAEALRGSFGFSGRDFTIDRAVASFDPARGALPVLDVAAHTSFDKSAVLRGGDARRVDIVEPSGASFDVLLTLAGDLSEDTDLALAPELSSPARIEAPGEGGPRPLSDGELLSLLTVGRLELGSTFVGEGSVAGSVAGSAVDTAVELFILSELQDAIGDALGLDLTIETSPLSGVLSGSGDPFGVSLELGGYVDDDLFASYRIGSYSDPLGAYALSNEFSLSYDLAPLKLNLAGGLNFTRAFDPVPEFGIALSYGAAPFTFDAGVDVSGLEQRFGLGVSFRW